MEMSLRLVLLGVGCILLIGLFWDLFRGRNQHRKVTKNSNMVQPKRKNQLFKENHHKIGEEDKNTDSRLSDFEEVVLVKSVKRVESASLPSDDIIALSIMARQPGVFLGKKLQDAFLESQLQFGEMDIFHRYDNRENVSDPIFSVASAVEPGTFHLANMDTMVTPGIMLFFKLTTPNQSIAAFELMLRIARQLAQRLDGELRDDRRRLLTVQSIENYREKVRMMGLKRHAVV